MVSEERQREEALPEGYRRSLRHLNHYRLFLVFALISSVWSGASTPA